jgi:choline dehydrogenase-like flavoprotein
MQARIFILATGGIEVPRLLLASNQVHAAGLGNEHDLVGRFFLEHPILQIGMVVLADPRTSVDFYLKHEMNGTVVKGFLSPTLEAQQGHGILNFGVRPNIVHWRRVSRANASLQILKEGWREAHFPDNFLGHLANVVRDIGDFVGDGPEDGNGKVLALKYWQECAPNPDSRVILGEERDVLGMNRAELNWSFTELDRKTMSTAIQLIGEEFGRAGVGRVNVKAEEEDLWDRHVIGSYHHMGTTRMHDDPARGVVDRDLRVHDVANLYVSSSSVFPTTGHANPTLTIVALSIRLADRVKELMS